VRSGSASLLDATITGGRRERKENAVTRKKGKLGSAAETLVLQAMTVRRCRAVAMSPLKMAAVGGDRLPADHVIYLRP
jgi:hypothetical protein